jgi:hypothetical protein
VTKRGDSPQDRMPPPSRPALVLLFAMLAPPMMALTQITLGYPLEHTSCATQSLLQFHILTVVMLAVTAVAGGIAHRHWVRLGSEIPREGSPPHGPRRLMALIGMIGAVAFGFFIIVQWLPVTMLPPCIRT